jgi:tetratricopeptide (TPR) repeat protein
VTRFGRQDAVRILHLDARELERWERAGLVPVQEQYSFTELGDLRTLRDLRARRISARRIRAALDAMHRTAGTEDGLREVLAAARGVRLRFRHEGSLLDPMTQQMAFDFEIADARERRLQMVGSPGAADGRRSVKVQEMFLQAVRLEEEAGTLGEAIALYEAILATRPDHAPTLINLGTIHYNQRQYGEAERLYRSATEADAGYALAFFDLGNVLDELERLPEATAAYQRAVELVPHYADAHYNLALSFERQGQRRRALRHWLTYVRLDPVGPWNAHARGQAKRTLKLEKLSIVSRRGRLVQAG